MLCNIQKLERTEPIDNVFICKEELPGICWVFFQAKNVLVVFAQTKHGHEIHLIYIYVSTAHKFHSNLPRSFVCLDVFVAVVKFSLCNLTITQNED